MNKYNLVACGGTFDHLHKGHKDFLNFVLDLGGKAVIGLTSDIYVRTFKKDQEVEPFEVRKKKILNYIGSIGKTENVEIVSIDDHFGPAVTQKYNFDCLAVTDSTVKNSILLNKKRKEAGLEILPVEVFECTAAQDGNALTSTRIRKGEVDRDGKLYIKKDWLIHNLILPEKLRPKLQRAFGKLVNIEDIQIETQKTITVGDVTTQKFNRCNANQFLSVIDFLVQRKKKFNILSDLGFTGSEEMLKIKNPPGIITPELLKIAKKVFQTKNKKVIFIEGEEDLAVLPVLLAAPLGFSIFYGQPGQGLVEVKVSEESKEKAYELVDSFIVEDR